MRLTTASVLLCLTFGAAGCQRPSGTDAPAAPSRAAPVAPTATVRVEDTQPGTGASAEAGKTVRVHYTGRLLDGKKFDSSLDRGQPIEFVLGRGMVIPGWDQGIAGLKVGGKRRLVIPPHLAYGASGAGEAIPPNATLVFDVELVDVR